MFCSLKTVSPQTKKQGDLEMNSYDNGRLPSFEALANLLVDYSVRVNVGDIVLVHLIDDVDPYFVDCLLQAVIKAGGQPIIWQDKSQWLRKMMQAPSGYQGLELLLSNRLEEIKKVHKIIKVVAESNAFEFSALTMRQAKIYAKLWEPIIDWYADQNKVRRVLTYLPTPASAQLAGWDLESFRQMYFNACLRVDYRLMSIQMDILVDLMSRTDRVQIIDGETDISFSIKGIGVCKADGRENMPDGEVYTAPVKESVNGKIRFNTPINYRGHLFDGVRLRFINGRIVECGCDVGDVDRLKSLFATDEGACYLGEFALGLNPMIKEPVKEILYDEKLVGSFHLTPGSCYPEADNGNRTSAIHMDLVRRQTPDMGGGVIIFDGKVIRRDGSFVDDLQILNPENLIS